MAKTLNEVIQSRLSQQPNQAGLGAGMQDAGAQTQNLLRAKAGKQVAGSGPAASSLAEQQAVTQTGQQLEGVQRRGQLVSTQQKQTGEAQEQAADIQSKQLEQKKGQFREQLGRKKQELSADRSRAIEELDYKKSAAATEQMGILSRLSADKYINQLQTESGRRRLDDSVEFKTALQESMYEEMEDLLASDIEFKQMLGADDREFQKELQEMDINAAMAVIRSQIRGRENERIWEAISGLAGAGAQAATKISMPDISGTTDAGTVNRQRIGQDYTTASPTQTGPDGRLIGGV